MCWWCCMRVLEKCLPRNDIVRELAPYLQHVHRDDGLDDDLARGRNMNGGETWGRPGSPRGGEFVSYHDDKNGSATSSGDSFRNNPPVFPVHSSSNSLRASLDDERALADAKQLAATRHNSGGVMNGNGPDVRVNPLIGSPNIDLLTGNARAPQRKRMCDHFSSSSALPPASTTSGSSSSSSLSSNLPRTHLPHIDSVGSKSSTESASEASGVSSTGALTAAMAPLQKKTSVAKIKTDLGDLIPVRWEKVVLVQVSVQGFREMVLHAKDLMEDAKLLYEHTVLSRLASEYGGQEILSHTRSGLFVIAFASEFHAAKWCLSLQLSLVYAAWNDKLLKQFDDMKEVYVASHGSKSKKSNNTLLYRGFRVRMVIHTADPDVVPEKSLSDAVKWTKTVSDYAHGGQIILSDSVWDRLKEQLVQLGNPVVEDLGCHSVLGDEVALMLLLPRDLEMRRFANLKSPHQLSLGMRDAPSAHRPVTMVFTFIEGARPLVRTHAEELADRIKTLCMVARELLRKHNGYECQELQGDFMLAFFNPCSAILWCGEFQLRIRQKFREWNRENENQELMFSMSMGIEVGVPASVSPHKTSGRADYFGNIVNQTARIAKAASGGQILIGGDAWNVFSSLQHRNTPIAKSDPLEDIPGSTIFQFKMHGYYSFKGISLPIGLIEAIPIDLQSSAGMVSGAVAARLMSRHPKAKHLDEAQLKTMKKTAITSVPSEMLRLSPTGEKSHDSIRETELGISISFDDSIVMVEEIDLGDDADAGSSDVTMMSGSSLLSSSNLNHSGFMQMLRSSPSLEDNPHASHGHSQSRAPEAQHMDRV
uniref:Guanylate cyclase domain-containing protein n=1 Tax=Globisporangium ultimum (strain ATCC 200006 / CBS 805.95 / DAOM BR144) TaxID=431595 RepID=K3X0W4_GLOUD